MPAAIKYFSEDVLFKLPNPRKTTRWIKNVVSRESATIDQLSYIFCSDAFLININRQFLNHNTFTDIITFDLSDSPNAINGEIYISIERVRENARKLKVEFPDELDRVMIHGVLHLLGYSDKKIKEKQRMREKEDSYLSLRWNSLFHVKPNERSELRFHVERQVQKYHSIKRICFRNMM